MGALCDDFLDCCLPEKKSARARGANKIIFVFNLAAYFKGNIMLYFCLDF